MGKPLFIQTLKLSTFINILHTLAPDDPFFLIFVSFLLPPEPTVDFLVVAGGGGASSKGAGSGGGGGGGGPPDPGGGGHSSRDSTDDEERKRRHKKKKDDDLWGVRKVDALVGGAWGSRLVFREDSRAFPRSTGLPLDLGTPA